MKKTQTALSRKYSSIKDGSTWEKFVSMLPISDPEKDREFVPARHWLVGVSCLILLCPSVYLFFLKQWLMASAGALAALLAFHADYVILAPQYDNTKVRKYAQGSCLYSSSIENPCVLQMKEVISNLDRLTAFGVTAYVHYATFFKFGAPLAVLSLFIFATFFAYSRRSSTFMQWVNRHTVFHIFVCLHSVLFSYLLFVY